MKLTDEDGSHRSKEKRGEIFISLRFGEPVVGGAAEKKSDFLSCVPLAQIEGYYKTRVQINFYATKIQAMFRGFLSRGGSGELMKQKSAEEMAQIKRIVNIQRKWRSKMMWRRIMSFKKAMTNGNVFMKVNASNGKISKRQIHCPGNMSTLYWREPGKDEDGNGMLVESMSAILVGRNTRTFQKCDQRTISGGGKIDKKLEGLSFSIVSAERTLDLVCVAFTNSGDIDYKKAEAIKQEWIDLFKFLLRDQINPASFSLIAKTKKFQTGYQPPKE